MQGGIPMNGIGNWFRQLGYKMKTGLQRFMMGRYGSDKLNMALLVAALVICLISSPIIYRRLSPIFAT